jgi:hypothetical protein
VAESQDKTYSQGWLEDFSARLNGIYVSDQNSNLPYILTEFTIHDLIQNSESAIYGSSIDLGNVILDEFRQLDNSTISGSRIRIGNFVLGNWWTADGERVEGTSQQLGDITLHNFTFPDGSKSSSSTLGIGTR